MTGRLERVRALLQAARALQDASQPLGQKLRREVLATSGLSRENVELALAGCLEVDATDRQLEALCRRTPESPRAHVLLSANVFTAGLRAIAIARASSEDVVVRASSREPHFVQALLTAAPDAFRVVDALRPDPGDHVWAYGTDVTLRTIERSFPRGITLHAHGSGMGVIVCRLDGELPRDVTRAMARDFVPFDQRGCLSPRLVLVEGEAVHARALAQQLAAALGATESAIPRGRLSPAEQADITRYRDLATYAGELFPAGRGWVGFTSASSNLLVAPVGRNAHVARVDQATRWLESLSGQLTTVAAYPESWRLELQSRLPRVRVVAPGEMQRPPLDGPVDFRTPEAGTRL